MSDVMAARGILLAHGSMADGIVDAVRQITGAEAGILVPLSNRGLAPPALAAQVRERIGDFTGPIILFTDLPSGSCGFAARMLAREFPDVIIVSGVNLPVLLEFVLSRELPIEVLVPRLLQKGRAAVGCAPHTLELNADPPVPRG
jgi:mannose/fructose-specific phosphotransferase system component IIA